MIIEKFESIFAWSSIQLWGRTVHSGRTPAAAAKQFGAILENPGIRSCFRSLGVNFIPLCLLNCPALWVENKGWNRVNHECICPLCWSVYCNFVRAPPPSPAWANFSIMMQCTPESGRCHSVLPFCVAIQCYLMLPCDVIMWDDNTPLFYYSWKLHSQFSALYKEIKDFMKLMGKLPNIGTCLCSCLSNSCND
jgi:hypothetical protein